MKRMMTMMLLALVCAGTVSAQDDKNEGRKFDRSEMANKMAERMADKLELKDDAKTAFVNTYKQYQTELHGVFKNADKAKGEKPADKTKDKKERKGKKELTDAEATAQIQEIFSRQEEAISQMQKRLEVQKKYYATFAKTLTPQQLLEIFGQQHRGPQMGHRMPMQRSEGGFRGGMGPQGNFGRENFGGGF